MATDTACKSYSRNHNLLVNNPFDFLAVIRLLEASGFWHPGAASDVSISRAWWYFQAAARRKA